MITELDNPFTEEYYNLKEHINSPLMAWYWSPNTTHQEHNELSYYGHQIMGRPDNSVGKPYSTIDSELFEETYTVLEQIFEYNNISVSVIYRINFNITTFAEVKKSPYHTDLDFPHKNLLIYMSKFTDGWTYVKDFDLEVKSIPKEDGIIVFDGLLEHCHEVPKLNERRIVLVVCYL